MLIDRGRDRPVRHLEWRVRLFGIGAILALVGMASRLDWMVNLAIGVLILGFLLRFLPARDGDDLSGEGEDDGRDAESMESDSSG